MEVGDTDRGTRREERTLMSEAAQVVGHGGAQVWDEGVKGQDPGVWSEGAGEGDDVQTVKSPAAVIPQILIKLLHVTGDRTRSMSASAFK